ncbi:MAG: FMN-binding protein [Natronospirillum sp.]|uniref:cytochrome b5 domain-containing protein n=1 Tax=Natronospirillum sp. TaxID=2812955 RepID=UPI0025E874E1|nr:cytochrome b5 domain-containing protein [Natronospirillum sp.]MCH8553197.1 FMN-binding protein [Natronospirillum sp.]
MNKIAYTLFIAFVASVLTLAAVNALTSDTDSDEDLREISLDELAEHDSEDSCWKAINDRVYDITDYIPNHPTPEHVITEWCGKESTEAWEDIAGGRGHSSSAAAMLERYRIGVVAGSGLTEADLEEDTSPSETERTNGSQERPAASVSGDAKWADGSYYAELEPDDRGWTPFVELTIKDGRIVGVHYDEIQRDEDGDVTDSKLQNYGYAANWRNNRDSDVSQLSAFPGYVEQLLRAGDPQGVDGISGATSTFDSFTAAVEAALADAETVEASAADIPDAKGGYEDGTYYAETEPNERGQLAMIEITVRDGYIYSVHYDEIGRDEDGSVTMSKRTDYGYAERWRNAVDSGVSQLSAFPAYVRQLIETGDPDAVDGISGATSTYDWFREVSASALEGAQ